MTFVLTDTAGNPYRLEANSLKYLADAILENKGAYCRDEWGRQAFVPVYQILRILEAAQQ